MEASDVKNCPYQANREEKEEIADRLVRGNLTDSGTGGDVPVVSPFCFLSFLPSILLI